MGETGKEKTIEEQIAQIKRVVMGLGDVMDEALKLVVALAVAGKQTSDRLDELEKAVYETMGQAGKGKEGENLH